MSIRKNSRLAVIALPCLAFLITACTKQQEGPAIQEGSQVAGALVEAVNLDQSWTTDTQQAFYFTDQGSRIMPYKWFLALEQASNQNLFRDNDNINRYRYLPAGVTDWNPDGLPVGFVKNVDKKNKSEWMGFTCAACHTTQLRYQGVEMRIDGGPTLADFETFNVDLVAALSATYRQQDKFERFALAVLGGEATPNKVNALRQALLLQTESLEKRYLLNRPTPTQPDWGFARVDAIGAIFNQILADFNGLPTEGRPADAPVSYPFLWGTHQADVVQWPGFAPNGPASIGALIRNGGEVLGVYGQLNVPDDPTIKHYKSSLNIKNLGKLEKWVAELRSPAWPAEYLPPVDPIMAAKGSLHYEKHCASCHQVIPRAEEGQPYESVLTPQVDVGTDITELSNMVQLRPAGKFAGRKEFVLAGPVIPEQTSALAPLVNAVVGSLLEHPVQAIEAAIIEFEGGVIASKKDDGIKDSGGRFHTLLSFKDALKEHAKLYENGSANSGVDESSSTLAANGGQEVDVMVYKARPLNGIWATAPYLHNGSVPNLAELLLAPDERSTTFYLGTRDYDPVNVGFDSTIASKSPLAFQFDVSLKGNSNAGHEYGTTELNQAEKAELLEYLKTL